MVLADKTLTISLSRLEPFRASRGALVVMQWVSGLRTASIRLSVGVATAAWWVLLVRSVSLVLRLVTRVRQILLKQLGLCRLVTRMVRVLWVIRILVRVMVIRRWVALRVRWSRALVSRVILKLRWVTVFRWRSRVR